MTFTLDHIDYYICMMLFIGLSIVYSRQVIQIAKGHNGVFQKEEVTWVLCTYLLIFYAIRIITLSLPADPALLAALIAGAGIGIHYSPKKQTPPTTKPPAG